MRSMTWMEFFDSFWFTASAPPLANGESLHRDPGTPLQKIAKGAKVNQALISYYFGSKEKLYQAVFLRRGLIRSFLVQRPGY